MNRPTSRPGPELPKLSRAAKFGGLAWLVALVVMMLALSAFDRERFYGARTPHRH